MSFFVNTMVCGFSLYQILAFFLIYSCLGWCLEVIYAAVSTGQLVNRGFLNGPVCPIYGFGMIIVLFTLSPLADNLLLLYIGGVILPSVLELAGGWALYKLYHTRWWDYSDFPFNIGGYICLEFSLLWGVGTVVVMKAVHPVIAGLVEMVPQMVGFVLMCILYACYAADVVVTAAWNTAPGTPESERRLRDFAGFQVTGRLMEGAKPDAMLLHCLPAHRGEEISAAVFEEHADEIFDEAENRLHVQKAVLAILLAGL